MNFGVIGAGQMGAGIAQVAAQSGFSVTVQDVKDEFLSRGQTTIEKSLAKLHEKGRLKETPADLLGRIKFTTDLQAFSDCDLVVEAVVENEAVKADLFRQLGEIVKPGASWRATPPPSLSPASPRRAGGPSGLSGCTS